MLTLDISKNLFLKYESLEVPERYYGLLAVYALAQTAVEGKDNSLLQKCITFLDQYPDQANHAICNFDSYRAGGSGKAWLLMKGYYDSARDTVKKYADMTLLAPRDSAGIVCYHKSPQHEMIWIDTVWPMTYMIFAGIALDEPRYIDFAAEQCIKLYEILLDKEYGLLHQSRGFDARDRKLITEDHWSRGNGWGYLGFTELVQYLPESSLYRKTCEEYFKALSTAFLPYQTQKGLWRQELTREYAWEESSGTALILYGFGVGLRLGILPQEKFHSAFQKGIQGLFDWCINKDFSTNRSCPGCNCPGTGDEKGTINAYITERLPYPNEHHSFGPFMLAMIEAHRNKIHEIERKENIPGRTPIW